MKTRLLAIALLLVAACGGSSGATAGSGTGQPSDNVTPGNQKARAECEADDDCATGKGCALPQGVCLPFLAAGAKFSVQVEPPEGSGLVTDQYPGVTVDSGGTLNLTLVDPTVVAGVVALRPATTEAPVAGARAEAPAGAELLSGSLIATAPGLVPQTQFRSVAKVGAQAKSPVPNGTDTAAFAPTYELRVVPGLSYSVAFLPDARPDDAELPVLPPYYFTAQFGDGRYDILLPARSEYTRITGVVVAGPDDAREPLAGANVTCRIGQAVVGTSATTDDRGTFSVVVQGAGAVTLRVAPGPGSPAFTPREFEPGVANGNEDKLAQAPGRLDAGVLTIGAVPPARDVRVQVLAADGATPVPTASVQAVIANRIVATTSTDKDGIARMAIPDGAYLVKTVPPAGSEWAAAVKDLSVAGDVNAQVVLDRRLKVAGQVVREASGKGVAGAVVTLVTSRVDALKSLGEGVEELGFDATTAEDGSFVLYVDRGEYALTVVPPDGSGLARYGQPIVTLTGTDAATAQPNQPALQADTVSVRVPIPDGALVRGRVTRQVAGADGSLVSVAVPDAKVRFFFDVQVNSTLGEYWAGQQDAGFSTLVQLAGLSTSDASGRFGAMVPTLSEVDKDGNPLGPPGGGGATFGLPAAEVDPKP